ncbi:hypothetical protein BVG79_00439 [Ketogulonicigenium robustum]|uniref:Uncharacterized protein n=1 Tax=Ketogulonicigenium robustum TaxID=92947 RepID=A0A1W6NXB0_9RHOB|nr:hypothetical protein BVG79_00439 [Ketogulonicigenium robustum]
MLTDWIRLRNYRKEECPLKEDLKRGSHDPMQGFVYFDIHDRARLPGRFFGVTQSVLARL